MRFGVVLFCLLGFAGCTYEIKPVEYASSVNYRTDKAGSLQLVEFSEGENLDQLFDVAREGKGVKFSNLQVYDRVRFSVLDERIFAESLAAELARKEVVSIGKVSDQIDRSKYLSVQLVFTKKEFDHSFGPNFMLAAALQLRTPNRELRKIYEVTSFDNDSFWDRMNSNAVDGKNLAATNLMNKMIPDIETFLQMESAAVKN